MIGHPAAHADVLVIGGGTAGLVAARTAAIAGRRAVVVEADRADRTPRGLGLVTPAAVATLTRHGLESVLGAGHRVEHVRISAGGRSTSSRWPAHPDHPDHGIVIDRQQFDVALGELALEAGAEIWFEHEATSPVVERGFVRGAHLVTGAGPTGVGGRFEARSEYVVVADGANSRFGRALGSFRDPSFPFAVAHHATHRSAIHDATEIEIVVGLRDRAGTPITGYGWMFPSGNGHVDVGVLLMSTSPSFQVLNPVHVLERFVDEHGDRWHLSASAGSSAGGRIPLGRSVGPAAGPTWLLVGDAAGVADPWSGAGLGAAVESGAVAGNVVVEALEAGSSTSLQRYPSLLDERFEPSYGVGLLADRLLGQPSVSRQVAERAARSDAVADSFLRLATGAVRQSRPGPAEIVTRLATTLGVVLPGV
jgi:geranylgeranyl reductase family protein